MLEGSQAFKEIQEILHLANIALEPNLLRFKILELLFQKLYVESSVFYLPGDPAGSIEVNLQERYVKQYKEHFHRYDPIQLINGTHYMRSVIRLEEVIDYHAFVSSKFYCDFLKPQKIHHKLYVNLYTGERYHGRIALFRPPKSEGFSEENVRILRTMAPFFAFALDHNDLLIKTRGQEGAFEPTRLKEIYRLTNREIDIVRQTYQGLKNAEIASRLFISEITVKKHIQNIFQKMGVRSRTALVHKILEEDQRFVSPTEIL